ncbi:hypothetical protein [Candidatus Nitrosopumilus sediminis]|uniref:ArnR1-like winged helix-turn-helix domain-containing protein n=1 Tax=Candidatus Nitrosopumilus sediminis TaxID=1229909 RepID=K0BCW9_9ARCH|nr:hypothetical protein NSED_02055 [Candidatus Nitrosopumilus sediminis]
MPVYGDMDYKLPFRKVIGPILSKIVNPKVLDIIKSKSIAPTFDPSMKTLMRIVKFMLEHPSEGKTQMALDTKLNYARLAKHVVWMEKKGLAKSTIYDNKIHISLTKDGRDFAKIIARII